MDLIKNADWIIDVGPGAGFRGGKIVAAGSPEKLIQQNNGYEDDPSNIINFLSS